MYAQNINLAQQLNQRPTYVPPVMPSQRPQPYVQPPTSIYQPPTPPAPTQGTQPFFQPTMPPHSQPGLQTPFQPRTQRGRGRNNRRNNNPRPVQQFLPQQQATYYNQGYNPNQCPIIHNPPSPVKRFANWNYCWSHGGDIHNDHHSATCQNPKPGHQWHATRQNMLGGSTKGMWKHILPS